MRRSETGSALLLTVAAGALVSALAGALVAIVMIEEAVEANHRRGVLALYAADGLLASVVADLAVESDWSAIVDGSGSARFRAGPVSVTLPDGSVVDAEAETAALPGGGDRPGESPWRLFAWGWLGDLAGARDLAPRLYLAAWLRDDRPGPDADPPAETNRRLVVRAAAFGPFGVRREVEATLARRAGTVRGVAWNVVR